MIEIILQTSIEPASFGTEHKRVTRQAKDGDMGRSKFYERQQPCRWQIADGGGLGEGKSGKDEEESDKRLSSVFFGFLEQTAETALRVLICRPEGSDLKICAHCDFKLTIGDDESFS